MKQKLIGFASAVSIVLFGAVITFSVLPGRHEPIPLHIPLIFRNASGTANLYPDHWDVELYVPVAQSQESPGDSQFGLHRFRMTSFAGFFLVYDFPDYGLMHGPPVINGYWSRLTIPLWFVLLVCSLLPLRTALGSWRRRRRERKKEAGLCIRCGYDLRASTLRCPECGEEVETQKPGIAKI